MKHSYLDIVRRQDKYSMSFDNNDYMIAWDVSQTNGPRIKVGPWPDNIGWSSDYALTTGCCDSFFTDLPESEQAKALLNQAASLMFHGITPSAVLQEFAKIGVWREMGIRLPAGDYTRAFLPNRIDFNPYNPT